MANKTHKAPIIPTSTHGKMLHKVSPSLELDAEFVGLKKSWMHLASALECLVADTIIQAAAIENAADVARPCSVTYRLYRIVFSCRCNTVNYMSSKINQGYHGNTNKAERLHSSDNKAYDSHDQGCR
jgi:hypothetical protein